jgi:hypothetical protein
MMDSRETANMGSKGAAFSLLAFGDMGREASAAAAAFSRELDNFQLYLGFLLSKPCLGLDLGKFLCDFLVTSLRCVTSANCLLVPQHTVHTQMVQEFLALLWINVTQE